METIKIPVSVGKREVLLRAKDTEIRLEEKVLSIKTLYVKETPKDIDDDFSPIEEVRKEYETAILKSHIAEVIWFWDDRYEKYVLEVSAADGVVQLFMEGRESAFNLFDRIKSWWLA